MLTLVQRLRTCDQGTQHTVNNTSQHTEGSAKQIPGQPQRVENTQGNSLGMHTRAVPQKPRSIAKTNAKLGSTTLAACCEWRLQHLLVVGAAFVHRKVLKIVATAEDGAGGT